MKKKLVPLHFVVQSRNQFVCVKQFEWVRITFLLDTLGRLGLFLVDKWIVNILFFLSTMDIMKGDCPKNFQLKKKIIF